MNFFKGVEDWGLEGFDKVMEVGWIYWVMLYCEKGLVHIGKLTQLSI